MKAMRAEMRKLNQPRMESVKEGNEVSSWEDKSEVEFEEESDNKSMDHNGVDNESNNDNESVKSYLASINVVNQPLISILKSSPHPKSTKTVTFKSLLGIQNIPSLHQTSRQEPRASRVKTVALTHVTVFTTRVHHSKCYAIS